MGLGLEGGKEGTTPQSEDPTAHSEAYKGSVPFQGQVRMWEGPGHAAGGSGVWQTWDAGLSHEQAP